jgi:hypothetical protein
MAVASEVRLNSERSYHVFGLIKVPGGKTREDRRLRSLVESLFHTEAEQHVTAKID